MGKESVDCRFGQKRGREEMERGRDGVKAEYIMGRDSSGGRGEGKCSTVGECGRYRSGRRPKQDRNFTPVPSVFSSLL